MGPERLCFLDVTVAVAALYLLCVTHAVRLEVRAKVGGAVEMDCSLPAPATGRSAPLHVLEWVRQGVDIPILIKFGVYAPRVHPRYEGRVSLVGARSLRVGGLLLEDQGWYECRVLLLDGPTDEGRNGTWTQLTVMAPPIFTQTSPSLVEALAGSPLSLACVASGNPPPTITWVKDGGGGGDAEVVAGTLSLRAVTREAGGEYTCHASNAEGNLTHTTRLRVKGPPFILVPPQDTALNMSHNALLRCRAEADPPNMTYVWRRDGENVYHIESLKSRVKVMVDGTLLIPRVLPEDSGNYTCMPTNGLLTPPTASASLTVKHPAQAVQMPRLTYLPAGLGGVLSCPVRAQPPLLHVDWTRDGAPLDLGLYPGWSLSPAGAVVMATVNDDARGVYACTPYNSYGTMGQSEPTTVILQDPPGLAVSPRQEYRAGVGGALLVPCSPSGDPPPTVTWAKVGPAPRSVFSVLANGSLLLRPVSKDQQGAWECSVANRVAVVKERTLVTVLGTSPHAASSVSVSPGVRQANVSWEPGADGGYPQRFTVWVKQMSEGDSGGGTRQDWFSVSVPPSSGTSLQVTGLSPATEYQFSVLPHNQAGTGPFSEIATVTTLELPPTDMRLEPPGSLTANQSSAGVVLEWSPPPATSSPVTGFVLQSRAGEGAWFNLDEGIGANRSSTVVLGLQKDCVYELRLLSRRGELLSEPGPSVNISTVGMDMYPASSRLLEVVAPPLPVGVVVGGVACLCLALLLVLATACLISRKRGQRRRKRTEDLALAIYKRPPSISGSLTGTPDSVLKQKLLHPHPHYPSSPSSSSSSSSPSSSSSSQSGRPPSSGQQHSDYRNHRHHHHQHQHLPPPDPPHHHSTLPRRTHHHLTRALSLSPSSSPAPTTQLELISRGPDGRFAAPPHHHPPHTERTPRRKDKDDDFLPRISGGIQRSASLRSERTEKKKKTTREPPFVLSVDLPPCGGGGGGDPPDSPNPHSSAAEGRVKTMAKHLSLHGCFYLDDEEQGCGGGGGGGGGGVPLDHSSLFLDSSTATTSTTCCTPETSYPQRESFNPGYHHPGYHPGSLKRGGGGQHPPAYSTSSTLVLQMEHEREAGNLSMCLKLAREREGLERELRKYTLERNTPTLGGEWRRERPGWEEQEEEEEEEERERRREAVEKELPVWKYTLERKVAIGEGRRERPGWEEEEEEEEERRREAVEKEPVWKPQDNHTIYPHSNLLQANNNNSRSCTLLRSPASPPPTYIPWDSSPLTSVTSLVPPPGPPQSPPPPPLPSESRYPGSSALTQFLPPPLPPAAAVPYITPQQPLRCEGTASNHSIATSYNPDISAAPPPYCRDRRW